MTYDEYNAFCKALPATTHVVQWGDSQVWKVGGKVFAIGGWGEEQPAFTFKTTEVDYEILRQLPGVRGAPYFASRGMKWIQSYAAPGLTDAQLKINIESSYSMIAASLSKKKKRDLGLALSD